MKAFTQTVVKTCQVFADVFGALNGLARTRTSSRSITYCDVTFRIFSALVRTLDRQKAARTVSAPPQRGPGAPRAGGTAASAWIVVGFQPQHVGERAFFGGDPPGTTEPRARRSRGDPVHLPDLLDWSRLEPSLPANALPAEPTAADLARRPAPMAREPTETALELPYRLFPAGETQPLTVTASVEPRH